MMARAKSTTAPDKDGSSSRKAERRARRHDLGREQLLDAAEELFGRRGFYETTLKEVAELAEFSVGSVYSFFEDKEDLYLQVFLRRGEEFLPSMRAVVEEGGSPLEQLHRLVAFEVGYFREHPHFGRLYLRSVKVGTAPPTVASVDEALMSNFDSAMELQAGIFARGQADGSFRQGDPAVLAHLFSGLVAAYQSVDPAVTEADSGAGELLPLEDLQAMIERAFT